MVSFERFSSFELSEENVDSFLYFLVCCDLNSAAWRNDLNRSMDSKWKWKWYVFLCWNLCLNFCKILLCAAQSWHILWLNKQTDTVLPYCKKILSNSSIFNFHESFLYVSFLIWSLTFIFICQFSISMSQFYFNRFLLLHRERRCETYFWYKRLDCAKFIFRLVPLIFFSCGWDSIRNGRSSVLAFKFPKFSLYVQKIFFFTLCFNIFGAMCNF